MSGIEGGARVEECKVSEDAWLEGSRCCWRRSRFSGVKDL